MVGFSCLEAGELDSYDGYIFVLTQVHTVKKTGPKEKRANVYLPTCPMAIHFIQVKYTFALFSLGPIRKRGQMYILLE